MFPKIFQGTTIPVLQEVIGFSQNRHEILAGNIANLDTPGYRVRDLSVDTFQTRLKEAIEARNHRNEHVSPGIIDELPENAMQKVKASMKHILFHDDSDVSMEEQVAELSKNQYMHNMAISIIGSQFRQLQAAISERV